MNSLPRLLPLVLLLSPAIAQEVHPARLTGLVTDTTSQPVPNCAITVELAGKAVAQTRTDGLGTFFFGKLPGQRIVVRAQAKAEAGAVAIDLTGLTEGFVPVQLVPTRSLRGRVTLPGGAAAAGVWVLASPLDSREFGLVDAIARTDADGRYELSHVLLGPVRVRAWSEAHGMFEARSDGADDAVLDCELAGESEREVAFVLRGATPEQLATARLQLVAQDARNAPTRLPPPLCELRPDAEGRWLVHGWTQDDRLVARIEVPGFAVVPPADFAPRGPRQWTSTFDLQRESTIVGVLHDERGEALAGQWLLGRSFRDDAIMGVAVSGRTAADGSFRLASPVAPGDKFVLALAGSDHALVHAAARDANLLSCYLGRHEEAVKHELVARHCGVARLRIVDAQGQPVRGAVVSLVQSGAGDRPVFRFQSGAVRRQVGTGADGVAEFRGVDLREQGMLRFDVVAAAGIATRQCLVGNGEDVALGDVEVEPAPTLAGIVRDAEGKPVAGARVQLMAHDEWMTQHVGLTGHDGRFAFVSLRPGRYAYVARRGAESQMVRAVLDLPAGGLKDLELRVK